MGRQVTRLKVSVPVGISGNSAHVYLPVEWRDREVKIEADHEPDIIKFVRRSSTSAHVYLPKRYHGKTVTVTLFDILPEELSSK